MTSVSFTALLAYGRALMIRLRLVKHGHPQRRRTTFNSVTSTLVMHDCRTTSNPEILLVNQVLLGEAIKKVGSVWNLKDYNELVFGSSAGPADRGKLLDKPYDEDNTGFIGSGMQVPRAKLAAAQVNP